MPSLELDVTDEARPEVGTVFGLLDLTFGYFVWAAHFLVVYIATAVACVLDLGAASASTRTTFLAALVAVTAAAAAILVAHAVRRYRQYRGAPERRFRMAVTLGNDAIATLAIVWQLFPILLVPACA